MVVAACADADPDGTAQTLHINGHAVSRSDIKRSAQLKFISKLEGATNLSISAEGYHLWERFYSSVPCSPADLATVISVRDICYASARMPHTCHIIPVHLLTMSVPMT